MYKYSRENFNITTDGTLYPKGKKQNKTFFSIDIVLEKFIASSLLYHLKSSHRIRRKFEMERKRSSGFLLFLTTAEGKFPNTAGQSLTFT